MKAVIYEKYGAPEVLQIRDVEKPAPKPEEVLIKINATTVTTGDHRMRVPDPFLARLFNGLFYPRKVKTLGFELAGEIKEVGKDVIRFQKGDAVYAFTGVKFGAYAEYICLPAENENVREGLVEKKPRNLSFEEAAAVPVGGLTALGFMRKAKVESGKEVLIYGASGSVGSYAVQIARYFGANVTGVCGSSNLEWIQALGAETVIDYSQEDFTQKGRKYDVIFDAVGKLPTSKRKKALKKNGKFFSVMSSADNDVEYLSELKKLCEQKTIQPVIDRTFPLDEIVEAHRYVDQGHKKGNVVITIP